MTILKNSYNFILAGNATFTILNTKTGNRFTYKVVQPNDDFPHFVKVLTGNDNNTDYAFLGTIFDSKNFYHGKKSKINRTAQSAKVFAWAWPLIVKGLLPKQVEIHHEGTCGRCGRRLTVPESIESGFGPICAKELH